MTRPAPSRQRRLFGFERAAWVALAIVAAMWTPVARAVTYANTSVTYSWIDASTHTKLGPTTGGVYSPTYRFSNTGGCGSNPPYIDDSMSDNLPIGFTFMYGGVNFTQVRVMSNGRLQFNNNTTCGYGSPVTQLPYPDVGLDYTMRIYGGDLDPSLQSEIGGGYTTSCTSRANCYVSYATIGTAPYRSFVVTWNQVPEWTTSSQATGSYNLQIILQENGEFIYQYGANTPGPGYTTGQVGWQVSNSASDYDVPQVGYPAANSAIKFYIARPTAEYRMEQPSWNGTAGEVYDTSGSGNSGVRVGSANTTGAGKVCRGANIPSNANTSIDAIDTGISIPTKVGGQGTITFWFDPNGWTGSGVSSNQLFDATIANNEWFYLTKVRVDNSNAYLLFTVRDSTGTTRSVQTGNLTSSVLSSGWVHIAVSWNFNALATANSDHLRIYVNGALSNSSNFSSSGSVSNGIGTLYIGDNRSTFIGPNGTSRSANGIIDEFRIYNYEGGLALIQRDMNQTGTCLDHYAISHAGTGQACNQNTVTVTAHTAAHGLVIMPNNTTQITLSTADGTGDWALLNGYGTFSNGAANDGVATYLFNGEYQAIFGLTHTTPGTVNINVTDGQIVEQEDPNLVLSSCVSLFNSCHDYATSQCKATGKLYTRLAGVAFDTDVVALDAGGNPSTGFTGKATVSLIARATPGGVDAQNCFTPDYTQVLDNALTSFTSGRLTLAGKTVSNAYKDVRIKVVCDATNCPPSGITGCSTDNFALRPQSFAVSANLGGATLKAGRDFTMTANSGVSASYTGTPQLDTSKIQDHNGSAAGTLNGSFTAATGVSATGTFQYQDVGTISLLTDAVYDASFTSVDQSSDCMASSTANSPSGGKYGCNIGSTAAGPFGRFYPDHFTYAATLTAAQNGFTYMSQPALGISLSLEARSFNETVTQRYTAGYGTLGTFSITGDNGGTAVSVSRLNPALPAFAWSSGKYSVSTTTTSFQRNASPDGQYDNFALKANILSEPDGVTISGSSLSNLTKIRFGRLWLGNAYGSDQRNLTIPFEAQYWNGSAFTKNTLDSTSSITNANIGLRLNGLNSSVSAGTFTVSSGAGSFILTKPTGTPLAGNVDIVVNLGATGSPTDCPSIGGGTSAAKTWLAGKWCGSNYDRNPTARATFGIADTRRGHIYLRESY